MMDRREIGLSGEEVAVRMLEEEGFQILWRNHRMGPLELDVVAKKDRLVVIVEVRKRGEGAYEGPLQSVTWEKQQRLLRAAKALWFRQLKYMPDVLRVRIDVIAISPTRTDWIRGAITDNR